MLSDITTGNTKTDGQDFRFWFVGGIEQWCKENEVRTVWAASSDKTAMSIMIRGDFIFIFREVQDHSRCKEGNLLEYREILLIKT